MARGVKRLARGPIRQVRWVRWVRQVRRTMASRDAMCPPEPVALACPIVQAVGTHAKWADHAKAALARRSVRADHAKAGLQWSPPETRASDTPA